MMPLLLKNTRLTDKLSTSHMITASVCQTTVGQYPQAKNCRHWLGHVRLRLSVKMEMLSQIQALGPIL